MELVEVITKTGKYRGILLPSGEIFDRGFIILKLENGYNIRIRKSQVKQIKRIKKLPQPKQERGKEIKFEESLPVVSILSTGGTIASRVDYLSGGVHASFELSDILATVPELLKLAQLRSKVVMQVMSEDMHVGLWKRIARAVFEELTKEDVDGVVVTHGTDTMHFTSAILSFVLRNLNKPVVLTGSQRSSDRGSSDAFLNLICSVKAATLDIAEVMVCMHGSSHDDFCYLHRGCRVRKMHTSRRDAFQSINDKPIAKVFSDGKVEFLNTYRRRDESRSKLDLKLEPRVALIYSYPGADPGIIDFFIDRGYKGIVIAGTGLGHVPTSFKKYSFIPKLKRAYEEGVAVCITSQCLFGRTNPYVYRNLRLVSMVGKAIYCEDMLPEVAYCKLIYVLGKTKDLDEVKKLMLTNMAGELKERSEFHDQAGTF